MSKTQRIWAHCKLRVGVMWIFKINEGIVTSPTKTEARPWVAKPTVEATSQRLWRRFRQPSGRQTINSQTKTNSKASPKASSISSSTQRFPPEFCNCLVIGILKTKMQWSTNSWRKMRIWNSRSSGSLWIASLSRIKWLIFRIFRANCYSSIQKCRTLWTEAVCSLILREVTRNSTTLTYSLKGKPWTFTRTPTQRRSGKTK